MQPTSEPGQLGPQATDVSLHGHRHQPEQCLPVPGDVVSPGHGRRADDGELGQPPPPPSNACLPALDETFSLYRPDSEASRLARGELSLREASAAMRARYAEAARVAAADGGCFTPERPDGVLDLSGIIKGYAIGQAGDGAARRGDRGLVPECRRRRAGERLARAGQPEPRGRPASWTRWTAGRCCPPSAGRAGHPAPPLATSGSAERGRPHLAAGAGHGLRRRRVPQVSVAAADIVTADVLATAIVAGGTPMLNRATDGWDIDVLAVRRGGELLATPGFRA